MYSEQIAIKNAMEALEDIISSWPQKNGIPSDFARLGAKKLKEWLDMHKDDKTE